MMPSLTSTRLHSAGSAEELDVLRRFLSGEPAKAAALARRAKALTRAAEAIRD